ncbi:hypothetical protein [Aeromicrobium sp. UC242_57]|uniref:hypothetical protein n=1 Tax=Aeromicrobium sp. UC242_57 TaxID=3374624 RepID=UPI0037A090CC
MSYVRRAAATYILPLLFAAEFFALFSRGFPWAYEWDWAIDWANGATLLLGPLLAGCVAADVTIWRRDQVTALTRSTPQGRWNLARVVTGNVLVGWGVHLAALGSVLAICLFNGAPASPSLAAVGGIALAFVELAVAGVVGALVGGVLGSLFAAPLAALVVFAGSYLASSEAVPTVFRVGGVTGSVVGLDLDLTLVFLLLIVSVAFIATAGLGFLVKDSVVSGLALRVSILIPGLVFFGGLAALYAYGDERFEVASSATHECKGTEPRICLASETSLPLRWLTQEVHKGYVALTEIGVRPPSTFRQALPERPLQASEGRIHLSSGSPKRETGDIERIAEILSVPRECPQLSGANPPPDVYFQSKQLLKLWLIQRIDASSTDSLLDPFEKQWLSADQEVQNAWIKSTYNMLQFCKFDGLKLPVLSS